MDASALTNNLDHLMSDMSALIAAKDGLMTASTLNAVAAGVNQQSILHQLNFEAGLGMHGGHSMLGVGNNGFNLDPTAMGLNGIGSLMPSAFSANGMMAGSMLGNATNPISSIFDPLPPTTLQQQQQQQQHQHQHSKNTAGLTLNTSLKKEEKFMLTPKPIEELMMPAQDKSNESSGKSLANNNGAGAGGGGNNNNNNGATGGTGFVHAFNKAHDPNLKNASSWSSLASAGSPQNNSGSASATMSNNASSASKSKPPAMDAFQQFRNKAKEKADRQKLLHQQEMRQKEALEKRQQQQEQHNKHHSHSGGGNKHHRSGNGGTNGAGSAAGGHNASGGGTGVGGASGSSIMGGGGGSGVGVTNSGSGLAAGAAGSVSSGNGGMGAIGAFPLIGISGSGAGPDDEPHPR